MLEKLKQKAKKLGICTKKSVKKEISDNYIGIIDLINQCKEFLETNHVEDGTFSTDHNYGYANLILEATMDKSESELQKEINNIEKQKSEAIAQERLTYEKLKKKFERA